MPSKDRGLPKDFVPDWPLARGPRIDASKAEQPVPVSPKDTPDGQGLLFGSPAKSDPKDATAPDALAKVEREPVTLDQLIRSGVSGMNSRLARVTRDLRGTTDDKERSTLGAEIKEITEQRDRLLHQGVPAFLSSVGRAIANVRMPITKKDGLEGVERRYRCRLYSGVSEIVRTFNELAVHSSTSLRSAGVSPAAPDNEVPIGPHYRMLSMVSFRELMDPHEFRDPSEHKAKWRKLRDAVLPDLAKNATYKSEHAELVAARTALMKAFAADLAE